MSIGNRVFPRNWPSLGDLVEQYRGLPVANISDSMQRLSGGGSRLRPYHNGAYLCGQALTVRVRPGDNLMVHQAIEMAQPGDVIVVEAGGDLTNSIIGEFILAYAERKSVAGFVIDGAIRDVAAIRQSNMPVFAAGVTHRGPYKAGPGEINVPVILGQMTVNPGDLIVGDDDGVLAIAAADATDLLPAARKKHGAEQGSWDRIRAGKDDRSWVEAAVRASGCVFMPAGASAAGNAK
ncbi:RraA family protein [Orrella dioscoreae]|uniref:Putative 4-hydroxy-4-methyl-2-oxoglutarate aldolase n=1 Tax=Orrella dioscoreae TaxID=1851544 RepID=A0A1C3K4Q1_9BURK|nr:RraA family protein [Orrella dioscoreae]SBT26357.1 Dimethylmenaquinone methyltransferase family protein [Orrella dioscoreae]SOE46505.1 Dimethylmenaquinone methyltransferase family protein [Orrella dioscoreae]